MALSSISSPGAELLQLHTVDAELWADAVSSSLIGLLAESPAACLCVPTGATPRPAYRRFADQGGDLSRATVFLLDEFGLAPGSISRCDEMIQRDLLELLPAAPGEFHVLDPQAADLEAECRRYEAKVRHGGLELAILGLGANGHLGLNEPGSERNSITRVVELTRETSEHSESYGSHERATWGMTMGIDTMLSAERVWLLVTGSHKAEILARMFLEPVGPELPATFLREHENVTVFADEPAAALL